MLITIMMAVKVTEAAELKPFIYKFEPNPDVTLYANVADNLDSIDFNVCWFGQDVFIGEVFYEFNVNELLELEMYSIIETMAPHERVQNLRRMGLEPKVVMGDLRRLK